LAARYFEENEIATVCLMMRSDLAEVVKAPRTYLIKFPYGAACGAPGDVETQRGVLLAALKMLESTTKPGTIEESEYRWKGAS
jgi:hypothetical protein